MVNYDVIICDHRTVGYYVCLTAQRYYTTLDLTVHRIHLTPTDKVD